MIDLNTERFWRRGQWLNKEQLKELKSINAYCLKQGSQPENIKPFTCQKSETISASLRQNKASVKGPNFSDPVQLSKRLASKECIVCTKPSEQAVCDICLTLTSKALDELASSKPK